MKEAITQKNNQIILKKQQLIKQYRDWKINFHIYKQKDKNISEIIL